MQVGTERTVLREVWCMSGLGRRPTLCCCCFRRAWARCIRVSVHVWLPRPSSKTPVHRGRRAAKAEAGWSRSERACGTGAVAGGALGSREGIWVVPCPACVSVAGVRKIVGINMGGPGRPMDMMGQQADPSEELLHPFIIIPTGPASTPSPAAMDGPLSSMHCCVFFSEVSSRFSGSCSTATLVFLRRRSSRTIHFAQQGPTLLATPPGPIQLERPRPYG